ncbi:hypothetical protein C8R45DRAFT_1074867 [Mycena sanguinolenta]|nr:hypothetical protein C8R45DRAFT_1074867 [Mycena sanguinolenta]
MCSVSATHDACRRGHMQFRSPYDTTQPIYNRFMQALDHRNNSEVAIRRALDDLFELAFQTDPNAAPGCFYMVESRVHVVKYDPKAVPRGPSAIATADGAVIVPLPLATMQTLRSGGVVYSGPDLHQEYVLSHVEYKGGFHNNGRQAILDSAALQAVNFSLGLTDVENHVFSFHHNQVDVVVSWVHVNAAGGHEYHYVYYKNRFELRHALGWLEFFSFLCQLRTHHGSVIAAVRDASPTALLTTADLFHPLNLSEQDGAGDRSMEEDDRLETSSFEEVSPEVFCMGGDDDDGYDSDARGADIDFGEKRERIAIWQKDHASFALQPLEPSNG